MSIEELSDNSMEVIPPGTLIANRYLVKSHLARGGMAHVYVAVQHPLNRPVAVKVLNRECSANKATIQRFMREAYSLSQLSHPNTVKIFDLGETLDNRLFIAMELLEGESLGDRIRRAGSLQSGDVVTIAIQVAKCLSEAHRLGIVHRDLKPDNIFLTGEDKKFVKVLDFGIAKLNQDERTNQRLTRQGTIPGTPEYMSPEQARGQHLDGRSDLYSLGVVMYEALCGEPPFQDNTFLATVLKHVQEPPPPLPRYIPSRLSAYIIDRLLNKDPARRPLSADVFIADITKIAEKSKIYGFLGASSGEELDKAQQEIKRLRNQLAMTRAELAANAGTRQTENDYLRNPAYPHEYKKTEPSADMPESPRRVPQAETWYPPNKNSDAGKYAPKPLIAAQRPPSSPITDAANNYIQPPETRRPPRDASAPLVTPNPFGTHKPESVAVNLHRPISTTLGAAPVPETISSLPTDTHPQATGYDDGRELSSPHLAQQAAHARLDIAECVRQFMDYATPMIQILGKDKAEIALSLAQNIWNAVCLGPKNVAVLMREFQDPPEIAVVAQKMVSRKMRFFSAARWQVTDLSILDKDTLAIQFKPVITG